MKVALIRVLLNCAVDESLVVGQVVCSSFISNVQAAFRTSGASGANGSITMSGMQKIFERMKLQAGFSETSTLVGRVWEVGTVCYI